MSEAFAYKSLESYYNESTSGGAFTRIVKSFFQKGPGIVYGAVLDEKLNVRHARVATFEECEQFRKSKYVKSSLNNVFQYVESDIKAGNRVLFSGTPCQVNALNVYVKRHKLDAQKLITVDIICNGAPNSRVWADFVTWLEKKMNRKLVHFSFRTKGDENNPYLTKAVFDDKTEIIDSPLTASYNRLFLKKLIIPKACFTCPFKTEDRVSDITLGDYWGADNIFSDPFLQNGVSLVLTNTEQGKRTFCAVENDNGILLPRESKDYLPYQENLRGISNIPNNYEKFWIDYNARGFGYVVNKYADSDFPRCMKFYFRRIIRNLRSIIH